MIDINAPLTHSHPRSSKAYRRLPPDVVDAIAAGDVDVVVVDAKPELPAPHPLDVLIEEALDEWQSSADPRCEGRVVRDTLADPAIRPMVLAWLADVGIGGSS
jgi:hypothetical protein